MGGGAGFPVLNERKRGKWWGGGGVGTGKGTDKSMRTRLRKLPFRKVPFSFSPMGAWGGQGDGAHQGRTFRNGKQPKEHVFGRDARADIWGDVPAQKLSPYRSKGK